MELERPLGASPVRTLCEINCHIVQCAWTDTELRRRPTVLPGPAFPDVSLTEALPLDYLRQSAPVLHTDDEPGAPDLGSEEAEEEEDHEDRDETGSPPLPGREHGTAEGPSSGAGLYPDLLGARGWLKRLWRQSSAPSLAAEGSPPPFAWHPNSLVLAACDDGDRLHVLNVGDDAPLLGQTQTALPQPLQPQLLLYHEFQHKVLCLQWRPKSRWQLAAAVDTGVCLWRIGSPGEHAAICSLPMQPMLGSRSGAAAAWMSFLKHPSLRQVSCCAWHPSGRLLAASSQRMASPLVVWDANLESSFSLPAAALAGLWLLRWSPCGSFLLAATTNHRMLLWETSEWTCRSWDLHDCGSLVDACWAPSGKLLLLAFDRQLSLLHLTRPAPSLDSVELPLHLPEVITSSDSRRPEADPGSWMARPGWMTPHALRPASSTSPPLAAVQKLAPVVEAVAWDPTGCRLAVKLQAPHANAGAIALYSTWYRPVVTATYIGLIHLPKASPRPRGRCRLEFHQRFKQGALLAVRQGLSRIHSFPLYFQMDPSK